MLGPERGSGVPWGVQERGEGRGGLVKWGGRASLLAGGEAASARDGQAAHCT